MATYTTGFKNVGNAEHRRDKRLRVPVFAVRMGDQRYDTVNWSLGGLLLGSYDGFLDRDMQVRIHIKVKQAAPEAVYSNDELAIDAVVVRHDRANRLLALKFTELTPIILGFFERSFSFHNRRGRQG